jgi:hypothetical protein
VLFKKSNSLTYKQKIKEEKPKKRLNTPTNNQDPNFIPNNNPHSILLVDLWEDNKKITTDQEPIQEITEVVTKARILSDRSWAEIDSFEEVSYIVPYN